MICMIQRVKIRKKGQITIPSRFRRQSNLDEGSEVLIETRDNEIIIHTLVLEPIKEGFGLFGTETLDSQELKTFADKSRIKSNINDK